MPKKGYKQTEEQKQKVREKNQAYWLRKKEEDKIMNNSAIVKPEEKPEVKQPDIVTEVKQILKPKEKEPEIIEPEIRPEPEELAPIDYQENNSINPITLIILFLLALILAGIIFFKDEILKIIGKKPERNEVE